MNKRQELIERIEKMTDEQFKLFLILIVQEEQNFVGLTIR